VTAYSVAQRTREMGIRMALGAQAPRVQGMVLGEGLVLAAIGVAAGLAGAFALNTALANELAGMLYGVRPVDPPTFIGVGAGCWRWPRRRAWCGAARDDPMVALRLSPRPPGVGSSSRTTVASHASWRMSAGRRWTGACPPRPLTAAPCLR
jgi:hypothetical protein